jgi:hypothetical protein
MRKIMKKIFVGTLKMILEVFLGKKIFEELSVEYLGSISGKNLRVITGEVFVGYFEEDFGENIDHYILSEFEKFSRFEILGCYNFGVCSSVAELLAGEILPLAWLVRHRRWEMTPISPDEEDVGVERSCCGDEFLSVLL